MQNGMFHISLKNEFHLQFGQSDKIHKFLKRGELQVLNDVILQSLGDELSIINVLRKSVDS